MLPSARHELKPNSFEFETLPLVKPSGFREYDARWWFGIKGDDTPPEINLLGIQALGQGLGTLIHEMDVEPCIVVGHDYRSYSLNIKNALMLGLAEAGIGCVDIGLAVSPMAYFAQFDLNIPCVAMVTASHNENGWTGVKMGANKPLTFGPDEMSRLRHIVLNGEFIKRDGGGITRFEGMRERYINAVTKNVSIERPIKAVVACGNGTAGHFSPEALKRLGIDVIEMDCELDHSFPRYNPNPEDHDMLAAMAEMVRAHGADLALGFDGDGDRCGVVDETGEEIFADKIGLMLARDLSKEYPGSNFVVDVKSTGLFKTDPVLKANGASVDYYKTGHSYIKRRTTELDALAGFEKSGHFFFRPPIGLGYDDGIIAAIAVLEMLNRNVGKTLSELKSQLETAYTSLTMSPHCADEQKYDVIDEIVEEYKGLGDAKTEILGRKIADINTINGVRVTLEDGSWVLVRASSNKPELVVVVESMRSEEDMTSLFRDEVKPRLAKYPMIGAYNQEI